MCPSTPWATAPAEWYRSRCDVPMCFTMDGLSQGRVLSSSWPAIGALVAFSLLASAAAAQDQRLVEAVERQDRDAVRTLVAASVDVDAPQPDGATPLHWAAHWNDLDTATLLIEAGATVNAVNELGVTPLSLAALNASAAMADALLGGGADPSAARPSGETVLMTAARTGNAELVRALLVAGADLQGRAHFQGQTPLMWAASEGHADVVQVLLEAGRRCPCPLEARDHGVAAGGPKRRRRHRPGAAGCRSGRECGRTGAGVRCTCGRRRVPDLRTEPAAGGERQRGGDERMGNTALSSRRARTRRLRSSCWTKGRTPPRRTASEGLHCMPRSRPERPHW